MIPISTIVKGEKVKFTGSYEFHKGKTFIIVGRSTSIKGYITCTLENGKGQFEFAPNELSR